MGFVGSTCTALPTAVGDVGEAERSEPSRVRLSRGAGELGVVGVAAAIDLAAGAAGA